MPEFPRQFPHLYLRGNARAESYTSKALPSRRKLPQRERIGHADTLRIALTAAMAAVDLRRTERDPELAGGTPGFYLDFRIPSGSENAVELLENRIKLIELVAVRQEVETGSSQATVFVPDTAADYFLRKVEAYRTENTKTGKP
jgi:hypothetical protein